jgi:hypothetical protein
MLPKLVGCRSIARSRPVEKKTMIELLIDHQQRNISIQEVGPQSMNFATERAA